MWLEFNRAFAKTPTETVNSGEVTEVAVKSATWRGLLETAIAFCESLLRNIVLAATVLHC